MPDFHPAEPLGRRLGYDEAVAYLYERIDYERAQGPQTNHQFRLERTEQLFESLGLGDYLFCRRRPAKVPIVHIAGTKGKGSTATMVSGILSAAGYRVGMYTSPHLSDLEERFQINGNPCGKEELIALVSRAMPIVDQFDRSGRAVSFFELTTALAVLHFDRNACDVIVLEVGLGGRLDSTNVCASTVAAITSIGLDHQRVLGDTIEQIAKEKAGIIKGGVPVVSGVTRPGAAAVIRQTARLGNSPLFEVGVAYQARQQRPAAIGSEFVFHAADGELLPAGAAQELQLKVAIEGAHQIHNASIAVAVTRLLAGPTLAKPFVVTDGQIAAGLKSVHCSGRMERFWIGDPSGQAAPIGLILDTSHNHDSIQALCQSLRRRLDEADGEPEQGSPPQSRQGLSAGQIRRPIVVVFGTSRDKDVESMSNELAQIADQIICTRYTTNPRSVPIERLMEVFSGLALEQSGLTIQSQADPQIALGQAVHAASQGGTVIICGSFFLAGELRPRILAMPNVQRVGQETPQRAEGGSEEIPNPGTVSGAGALATIDVPQRSAAVEACEADVR